jgi:omega-amidase
MDNLEILALQVDLVWENPAANRARIEHYLQGQGTKADLVVLPEMFTTGFSMEAERLAETMDGPSVAWMKQMASDFQAVMVGSLIIEEEKQYFNRLFWVEPSGAVRFYDKRHLFAMGKEDRTYTQGQTQPVFDWHGWKVLPQICYDLRFPVWSRNAVSETGEWRYHLALYVANWPEKRGHHWQALLKARAVENQAYIVGVNRVGEDAMGMRYSGGSMIVHPHGEVLASATGGEAVLKHTLKKEDLALNHRAFPFWKDADHFSMTPKEGFNTL